MSFCQACGERNLQGARFCASCGASLVAALASSEAEAPASGSSVAPAAVPAKTAVRSRNGRLALFALLGAAVIVVAIAVYVLNFAPMSADQYQSEALLYTSVILSPDGRMAFPQSTDTGLSSNDPNERSVAKKDWDTWAKKSRAALVGIRGLRPPSQNQATQRDLLKGAEFFEKFFTAGDALVALSAKAGLNQSQLKQSTQGKAFIAIDTDPKNQQIL